MLAGAGANPVHIIGASGRSGSALCRALLDRGRAFVPLVRRTELWQLSGIPGAARCADLDDPGRLASCLRDARVVVSTAHARFAAQVIAAAPPDCTLLFLGSTRKFTRWPDRHGNGVLDGERAWLGSGRNGVMLHPTMIYGAQGERNVRPLAALLRRLPVLPLPGGGHALVQPIHQNDVTRCLLAALEREWRGPHSLVIAGPEPVAYHQFAEEIAQAFALRRRPVLAVPAAVLIPLAAIAWCVPGLPRIGPAQIRRLLEDKIFDITEMRRELGVEPISLRSGLAAMAQAASIASPRPA